jgi:hypothetical protein
MISQVKTKILEDLDISHPGCALAEGQTQVSFALVQEGEVTADGSGALSATLSVYLDEQDGAKRPVLVDIGETATGSTDSEEGDDYPEVAVGRNTPTIKSIAACASKQGAARRFDCESGSPHTRSQSVRCRRGRPNIHNAHVRSTRLARHEGRAVRLGAWCAISDSDSGKQGVCS